MSSILVLVGLGASMITALGLSILSVILSLVGAAQTRFSLLPLRLALASGISATMKNTFIKSAYELLDSSYECHLRSNVTSVLAVLIMTLITSSFTLNTLKITCLGIYSCSGMLILSLFSMLVNMIISYLLENQKMKPYLALAPVWFSIISGLSSMLMSSILLYSMTHVAVATTWKITEMYLPILQLPISNEFISITAITVTLVNMYMLIVTIISTYGAYEFVHNKLKTILSLLNTSIFFYYLLYLCYSVVIVCSLILYLSSYLINARYLMSIFKNSIIYSLAMTLTCVLYTLAIKLILAVFKLVNL